MRGRRWRAGLALLVVLTACSDPAERLGEALPAPAPSPSPEVRTERRALPQPPVAAVIDGTLAQVTAELGRLAYVRAAVVVVATDSLPSSLAAAVATARALSAPLVVGRIEDGHALADELAATRLVAVGATAGQQRTDDRSGPAAAPRASPAEPGGGHTRPVATVEVSGLAAVTVGRIVEATGADGSEVVLPPAADAIGLRRELELPGEATVALVDSAGLDPLAVAAAAAVVGIETVDVPRLSLLGRRQAGDRLAERAHEPALAISPTPLDDDQVDTLRWLGSAMAAGNRILPDLGWRLLPDVRLVGLYGHPQTGALGVLGEQPVEAAVERAVDQAGEYAPLSDRPVVPMFEIIATVASGETGVDGDRSRETAIEVIEPWVDAAEAAGVYVLLDLQPGLSTFLEQAQEYEPLLRRPHVGLALDPEWRLDPCPPRCRHLTSIGSVAADEVNDVAGWLADLVVEHALPQKLLLVHQFTRSMIRERERLRTDLPQLAVAIQMDGQGSQPTKLDTWRILHAQPDAARYHWGWKNFHDEDTPTRSPADTMAVEPTPAIVTYQ